jgi:hypothetical protein
MCRILKKHLILIAVFVSLLNTAQNLHASSVIPPRDFGVLVQTSGLVVVAKAGDSNSFGRGNLIMTSTRFQVVDVIKGSIAIGQSFNMESYGGQTEDYGMAIGGSPTFVEGETYLLSLSEHNGAWMSRHMSYGLLVQRRLLTGERIFTHLEESHDLNLVIPDGKTVELISNYKAESLVNHLKSVASGKTIWNKVQADEVQEYDAHQSQSILLPGNIMKLAAPPTGCEYMETNAGSKIRWKRFEDNQSVSVKLPLDQPLFVTNSTQNSVNAWKAVSGININTLTYSGGVNISATCGTGGVQIDNSWIGDARIFPNDPCNQVADLISCSGTLAVAGPAFGAATHTANSETWVTALAGFMVINNGIYSPSPPSCISATQYEQVITHELGHILGFGHHTGATANMNANCCSPITDLDRACAVYIYGSGEVTTNPLPTITSITPNSIKAGTSNQPVVITGSGYQSTSSLFISPDLLGLNIGVQSFNSTTINMTFTAPTDVTLGVRKFFVRNPSPGGGDSQQVDFFVTDTPTISSISPTSGNSGSTVNVTISGTKFATGLSSLVVDSDLTVSNFTVVSPTQITASITIPSNATTSTRTIRVSNLGTGGGNSNTQNFNIIGSTTTTAPIVTTAAISSITTISATGGGNVTSDGGAAVTARGVCYATTSNPTTSDTCVSSGSGTGAFTANLTSLSAGTTYNVRAYATNTAGTSYGNEVSFTTDTPSVSPTVTTTPVSSITTNSATTGGNVTSQGSSAVTTRGVCYATTSNPTTSDTCVSSGSGTGAFTANLTSLSSGTTYNVRAYATNTAGTSYGSQVSFTTATPAIAPSVSTAAISSIGNSSATAGGNVTNEGSAPVTARGVCYATTQNPTTANTCVSSGTGAGSFTVNISGLSEGTTYYVRAYATNSVNTSYGGQVSFTTTTPGVPPTVTTDEITSVSSTSATAVASVSSQGSSPVTDRGICYATTQNPTTSSNCIAAGSGTGGFVANLSGLSPSTLYYVRAYASNTAGLSYGNQLSFTTSAAATAPTVTTSSVSSISATTATGGGNVTSEGSSPVTARGVCYAITQNPSTSNSCVTSGAGLGTFTANLTGLSPGTLYYVRAFATNAVNTSYGSQLSFQTGSAPINKQPTINPISNVSFLHSTNNPVSIPLTGITAGAGESGQSLSVTARSSDPLLIPFLQVDYTSPQTTGILRIQNNRTRVGSATISVRVKDDGGTANGGVDSVLVSFVANVILDTNLEDDVTSPQDYRLDQNYPNPFNPSTKISFQIPSREMVSLSVYDTMGRQRLLLVEAELSAGTHTVTVDASSLPSGIYMYVLNTKSFTTSRKMTLIK